MTAAEERRSRGSVGVTERSTVRSMRANALLLVTAMIWGFAFVAQRVGMDYIGPFTFNAIRFAVGSLSLVPLIQATRARREHKARWPLLLKGGLAAGTVLFAGASLQQVGLVTTSAGKAGFITGLYVVLVPLMGLLWGQRVSALTWLGALVAVVGLYLLSVTERLTVQPGDLWVLLGAVGWTAHVHLIDWLTERIDPLPLASVQFAVCSLLSWVVALTSETTTVIGLSGALLPLLYGGFMSVGVAYTLQVVAQRDAHPTPAAIIMSLESAFAAVGGGLLLGEQLGVRGTIGAALMLVGMVLAQIRRPEKL
jgi:drug/metabolite transporter (DMT)-like permease